MKFVGFDSKERNEGGKNLSKKLSVLTKRHRRELEERGEEGEIYQNDSLFMESDGFDHEVIKGEARGREKGERKILLHLIDREKQRIN